MLIKKESKKRNYIILAFSICFFIVGSFYWLLKHESKFTVASEFKSQNSALNIKVDKASWFGRTPYYAILSDTNMDSHIKVEGARQAPASIDFHKLPNYPKPVSQSSSAPKAMVLSVSDWKNPGNKPGNPYYKTFLLDTLPLRAVSLSAPYAYFFGSDGLYSVKNNNAKEFAFPIHFELLDSIGNQKLSLPVNAEVAGRSTKKLPMKSLNIRLKNATVDRKVFFDDTLKETLYSLRLRNAGNDFLLAYMRDAVVTELCKNTNNIILHYEPVVMFINGEFWGLQYIREHISEKNLRARYSHLRRDQILVGELYENQVKVISSGFDYKLGKLMEFVEKEDLSLAENYEKLGQMLNLENFIDYVITQTFICNTDWPHNNVKGVFLDDQLHFILYDTDFAFAWPFFYQKHVGNYFEFPDRIYNINTLTHNYLDTLDHYVPSHVGTIYRSLTKSAYFCQNFIARYKVLMAKNFSQHHIEQTVHKIRERIAPVMPDHIARWGYPASMEDWHLHTEQIIAFCEERRTYVLQHLEKKAILAIN